MTRPHVYAVDGYGGPGNFRLPWAVIPPKPKEFLA